MRRILLLSLLLLQLSASSQTTIVDSIYHMGGYRNYRLYVPASYDGSQAVPLVLNLHGYGSNALEQEFYGDFRPIADTANFIIVHPNGLAPLGTTLWNAGYYAGAPYDLDFMDKLIDSLSASYNINQNRIYSCGMSNGGIMSYHMACNLNERFAAIGSVTGSMTSSMYGTCTPPQAIPVIEIHGTSDGTVPYSGGSGFAHIDSVVKFWSNFNACDPIPVVINYPDVVTSDLCTATEYLYANGTSGAEVVLVKITSGGHTWPGAPISIGVTNRDFDASIRLWQFFMQFDKSNFTSTINHAENSSQPLLFPNPSTGLLNIRGLQHEAMVKVYDISGKLVQTFKCAEGHSTIDLTALMAGMYTVTVGNINTKVLLVK